MKKHMLMIFFIFIGLGLSILSYADQRGTKHSIDYNIGRLAGKHHNGGRMILTNIKQIDRRLICVEMDWYTGRYPITLDFLYSQHHRKANRIKKIIYLVSPSGLNFKSTFLTPSDRNIALYFAKRGYLVIGVTFPENRVPADEGVLMLADWGLEKHRQDLERVTKLISGVLPYHFDMLGQASSAVTIMDYAAHNNGKLDTIILLDTDSFDPVLQPEKVSYAGLTYNALNQLIDQGITVDPFVSNFKSMVLSGFLYPDMDSGVARDFLNLPGNFTLGGLLNFSIINTAFLPGIHTPLTGLPGEWVMIQGIGAGFYNFSLDPMEDYYGLYQSSEEDLMDMASKLENGSVPLAINRDIFAVLSLGNEGYKIPWKGIQEKVIMINGQYSSGEQMYYGTLIEQNSHNHVFKYLIPHYAYLDLLYGINAEQDVWVHFDVDNSCP